MMLRPVPEPADDDERRRCPIGVCEGNGWVLQEDGTATPCDCRERRINRAASRGMGSGIPKRFQGVSFDRKPVCDLDPGVVRHVRRFCDALDEQLEAGRGLWFAGDVGTGKTSLAMLIAKRAIDEGRSVAVYSVPRLLGELRASYDPDSRESFVSLFRRLCAVDLLVLDDLGAERQTEWVLEQLYSIVNERWQDSSSILVTSNAAQRDRVKPVAALNAQIEELGRRVEDRGSRRELEDVVSRLEKAVRDLAALESRPQLTHLERIKAQVGDRTVSRLREICDDPIPIMGPDLRLTSAG